MQDKTRELLGRPVAVFDLDGCLFQGPYHDERTRRHLHDPEFWDRHWSQTDAPCHPELVEMARGLLAGNFSVLILTARPETYHDATVRWLQKVGRWEVSSHNKQMHYGATGDHTVHLMMITSQCELEHELTGAQWKREVIRSLMGKGVDIRFVVEDYKPNADVIREVVPVLLYERQKPHPCAHWCRYAQDVAMAPNHSCRPGYCYYDDYGFPPEPGI